MAHKGVVQFKIYGRIGFKNDQGASIMIKMIVLLLISLTALIPVLVSAEMSGNFCGKILTQVVCDTADAQGCGLVQMSDNCDNGKIKERRYATEKITCESAESCQKIAYIMVCTNDANPKTCTMQDSWYSCKGADGKCKKTFMTMGVRADCKNTSASYSNNNNESIKHLMAACDAAPEAYSRMTLKTGFVACRSITDGEIKTGDKGSIAGIFVGLLGLVAPYATGLISPMSNLAVTAGAGFAAGAAPKVAEMVPASVELLRSDYATKNLPACFKKNEGD